MLLLVSDVVFCNSKKKNNLLFEPKRVIIKTMWIWQSLGLSSWYQHNCTNNVDLDEISNIPLKEGICCDQCFCKWTVTEVKLDDEITINIGTTECFCETIRHR